MYYIQANMEHNMYIVMFKCYNYHVIIEHYELSSSLNPPEIKLLFINSLYVAAAEQNIMNSSNKSALHT
jgi:hypothetical protein